MSNKIRKLSIGAEVKEQWHYIIGGEFPIPINGKDKPVEKRTLTNIQESENHYKLYISNGEAEQHWKDIPKNNITTPEYFID
jgi:hypothetical protein